MATPSQAQLVQEKETVLQDIEMLKAARQELIDKGRLNAAKEYDRSIAVAESNLSSLNNKIENYTNFSAERAAQDAEIKSTQDFETRNNPANQKITNTTTTVSETVAGGGSTTISGAAPPEPTPAEAQAAKLANQRASAFQANPDGRFGKGTIDRAEQSGAITKEEADKLRNKELSPDERQEQASTALKTANATVGESQPPLITNDPSLSPLTQEEVPKPQKVENVDVTQTQSPAPAPAEQGDATQDSDTQKAAIISKSVGADLPKDQASPSTTEYDQYKATGTDFGAFGEPPVTTPKELAPSQAALQTSAIYGTNPLANTQQSVLNQITQSPVSVASSVNALRTSAQTATTRQTREQDDWRIRIQLAPGATYLYNDPSIKLGDLLYPLKQTNGVVFPYTPTINSAYRANYEPTDLAHVNYKQYFYKNSSIDDLTIQADFTAQDTTEALYLLAVIHFFKSVTKMFYGQDGKNGGPKAGTPPPLCYLSGYGPYQYHDHPLLIAQFTYNLPADVDYIRAGSTAQWPGQNLSAYSPKPAVNVKTTGNKLLSFLRLSSSKLQTGGISKSPDWNSLSTGQVTYIPTKMSISLTMIPVVTRYDITNNFSVEKYAKGELLKGGMW